MWRSRSSRRSSIRSTDKNLFSINLMQVEGKLCANHGGIERSIVTLYRNILNLKLCWCKYKLSRMQMWSRDFWLARRERKCCIQYCDLLLLHIHHTGRYYQSVETHFLGHFTWCIARLVAPEQKLVQQIFFLEIVKLRDASLQKKWLSLVQNLLSQ